MNRYKLEHPNTATVWFPLFQSAADYVFDFRHSLDFEKYRLIDTNFNIIYTVKNCDTLNGIEFSSI